MPLWFRLFYSALWRLALPLALLRLCWKGRLNPDYRQHWRERLGRAPPVGPFDVWIHAVSVGEARAVLPVLRGLQMRGLRLLVTCTTPTGRATLQSLLGQQTDGAATIRYLPFDAPWLLQQFFASVRPKLGLLVETELWPGVCDIASRSGVKLWLINARLSQRSAAGYAKGGGLTRQMLSLLDGIAAQSMAHAERFRALGCGNVRVTGNVKFDLDIPADIQARGRQLAQLLSHGRPFWVAGSTREGEEALLLRALAGHPLRQRSVAVLVPRHPERWDGVATLANELGFRVARRSAAEADADAEVVIGDSMGEMLAYYSACTAAIMGGTLGGTGGQNLIEPCALGVPVILGPSVFNFQQAADEALAAGAALAVQDAVTALDAVATLLDAPQVRSKAADAARQFVAAHRGATARTLDLLQLTP